MTDASNKWPKKGWQRMTTRPSPEQPLAILERHHFQRLLDTLIARGYQVVGPTVRDQAIIYAHVVGVDALRVGYTDEQDGGTYRKKKSPHPLLFGYAVGQHS